MTKRILVADGLADDVIAQLNEKYGAENVDFRPDLDATQLPDIIANYDVVCVRSTEVNEAAVGQAKSDVTFIRAGSGTDNLKAAIEAGLMVQNTPGANAMGVVDLAVGLMAELVLGEELNAMPPEQITGTMDVLNQIVAERRIRTSNAAVQAGQEGDKTVRRETLTNAMLDVLKGDPIPAFEGKKILLTGVTGNIGSRVAQFSQAMGMEVLAVEGRRMTPEYAAEHGITLCRNLEEGLAQADVVSLHTPLVKEGPNATIGMMGQAQFDAMKPGAVFVNTGRAGLMKPGVRTSVPVAIDDMPSKIAALGGGFEHLLISPKRGAKTLESGVRVGLMVLDQIDRTMTGREPVNVVRPKPRASEVTPEGKVQSREQARGV